jgi:hypothetical protein
MSDVFFVPTGATVPGPNPGGRGGKKPVVNPPPPPPPPPPPGEPVLKLLRIDGGFRIGAKPNLRGAVTVEAAYEVRRGNAFKRYDKNDFEFGKKPLKISGTGMKVARARGNRLEVIIDSDDFLVEVTGFDPNRDLSVRARHLEEIDGASEEDAA